LLAYPFYDTAGCWKEARSGAAAFVLSPIHPMAMSVSRWHHAVSSFFDMQGLAAARVISS
jgi:hypothetical protein